MDRQTNGQTDGWTELRWLRRAEAVAAFACKNFIPTSHKEQATRLTQDPSTAKQLKNDPSQAFELHDISRCISHQFLRDDILLNNTNICHQLST